MVVDCVTSLQDKIIAQSQEIYNQDYGVSSILSADGFDFRGKPVSHNILCWKFNYSIAFVLLYLNVIEMKSDAWIFFKT